MHATDPILRRGRFIPCLVLLPLLVASVALAEEAPVINVWPGEAPGLTPRKAPEKADKSNIIRIGNVVTPTLTVYRPPADKANGAAVIICPGGGYSILAWDLEGTEVADWLNRSGVTGIVLKYRVPEHKGADVHGFPPLMDAQRAISLVRSKATELGIDPKRLGILGFSAGGNLAALACTNYDRRSYDAIDDVDKIDCRPDFGVLVYPAYLLVGKTDELAPEIRVTSQTPPCFFVHADDDHISAAGSAVMYLALKKAGVQASELHIYSSGGHGFGLRPTTRPASAWPERCDAWMKAQGLLEKAK